MAFILGYYLSNLFFSSYFLTWLNIFIHHFIVFTTRLVCLFFSIVCIACVCVCVCVDACVHVCTYECVNKHLHVHIMYVLDGSCTIFAKTKTIINCQYNTTHHFTLTQLYYITSGFSFYFIYDFCVFHGASPLVIYFLRFLPFFISLILCPLSLVIRYNYYRILSFNEFK